MRLDLKTIRDMDRATVLGIVTLVAGVAISGWLVSNAFAKDRAADAFAAEVERTQLQVDALPRDASAPVTPEQVAQATSRLFAPDGEENALREQLAQAAVANNIEVRKMDFATAPVDPTSTAGADPLLLSLGIANFTVITIDYVAQYDDAARFIGAIEQLPQRVLVTGAELRRDPPRVGGTLVMRVYRKGS